ncbi:hypothetical protein H8959_009330 [Pygathrix nigripes]
MTTGLFSDGRKCVSEAGIPRSEPSLGAEVNPWEWKLGRQLLPMAYQTDDHMGAREKCSPSITQSHVLLLPPLSDLIPQMSRDVGLSKAGIKEYKGAIGAAGEAAILQEKALRIHQCLEPILTLADFQDGKEKGDERDSEYILMVGQVGFADDIYEVKDQEEYRMASKFEA